MSKVFAYCPEPAFDKTIFRQLQEIAEAGFDVRTLQLVREVTSGSVTSCQRPVFNEMMDDLRGGDTLIVTKLDRLGRNAMDVLRTVEELTLMNVRVHCLALGVVDLTSPAGKATMDVMAAVAEFEHDLLVERTQAGLARVKDEGKKLGRPRALTEDQEAEAMGQLSNGKTVSEVAKAMKASRATIMRLRDSKTTTKP